MLFRKGESGFYNGSWPGMLPAFSTGSRKASETAQAYPPGESIHTDMLIVDILGIDSGLQDASQG